MILYSVATLILALTHALKILNNWILWESNHPSKKSSFPKCEHQSIRLVLNDDLRYKQLKESSATSDYPSQHITYHTISSQLISDKESVNKEKSVCIVINEDVQLTSQWLTTINAYSQYPYIHSFQTPILYGKVDDVNERVNQVKSLKYILQLFLLHQENKTLQFERMISIKSEHNIQLKNVHRLLTNPEFVSYSNTPWSSKDIREKSILIKFYPQLIVLNIILGFFLNPIFGFLAVIQLFIYAVVDYLVLSRLASFYSLPKATKWYIISFAFHLKDLFLSIYIPNLRSANHTSPDRSDYV